VLPQLGELDELLIVDNGSTDGTLGLCRRLAAAHDQVRVLHELKPGLSVARNHALQKAIRDWVIFLDDDTIVKPGWLSAYREFLGHDVPDNIAALGGSVMPLYETSVPDWLPPHPVAPDDAVAARRCEPGESVIGCNFAVRRQLTLQMGGFNTRLGHCGEVLGGYDEVELIERFTRAGYEIWWVTGACVQHLVSASRLRLLWQLNCAFRVGHCSAIRRLSKIKNRPGTVYFSLVRLLTGPFHCGFHLLAAGFSYLIRNRRKATRSLLRASSIAGYNYHLMKKMLRPGYA
jgi:glycosyltransferase involved in cell wall biosynthesis